MSKAMEKLETAQKRAMAIRPKVGGFPYLAEVLRQAGVKRNLWFQPSCQSSYLMDEGLVVTQGTPFVTGTVDVPKFDRDGLIAALRADQARKSTFPESLFRRRGARELSGMTWISRTNMQILWV
jgi:uncharacterized protein YbcV (DUF1398 family)